MHWQQSRLMWLLVCLLFVERALFIAANQKTERLLTVPTPSFHTQHNINWRYFRRIPLSRSSLCALASCSCEWMGTDKTESIPVICVVIWAGIRVSLLNRWAGASNRLANVEQDLLNHCAQWIVWTFVGERKQTGKIDNRNYNNNTISWE